jgi:tight adherence protein B
VPADGRGLLLAWRRWQRLRQQVQQLPAFIDGMVRMVVLGHATVGLFAGLGIGQAAFAGHLEPGCGLCRAGMPVDQALATASRHWGLEAFSLLAAILQVGGRFGGRVDSLLERWHFCATSSRPGRSCSPCRPRCACLPGC